jgi:hypothetical protein
MFKEIEFYGWGEYPLKKMELYHVNFMDQILAAENRGNNFPPEPTDKEIAEMNSDEYEV